MTNSSHMTPIDRNGFFCTSRKALEGSTEDSVFTLEPPQCQHHGHHHTSSSNIKSDTNVSNKSSDAKISFIITPERPTEDSTKDKNQTILDETKSWVRAILEAEPCIVTQKGLFFAVKNNAPVQVIRFMLTINPNIMDFPKTGPTPLQVAVQHNAKIDIVQLLLEAWPFGLCTTNNDSPESPLDYVKRNRSDRPDLIELLSRPLDYWFTERISKREQNRQQQQKGKESQLSHSNLLSKKSSQTPQKTTERQPPLLSPPPSFPVRRSRTGNTFSSRSVSEPPPPPPLKKDVLKEVKNLSNKNTIPRQSLPSSHLSRLLPEKKNTDMIDREEMNNVKTLCALLYKAHRKMAKQMTACKDEIESQSKVIGTLGTKDEILEELMKEQRSQMFRNWIALDIKERAYQSRLDKMEQRYVQQLEKRLESWMGSMRLWNDSTRQQLQELQTFVESEVKTSGEFRNNMTDWIEKQKQNQENNASVPSHVFATNLGEVNDKVPLCGTFRGFCGYGTDSTDNDTDPIIGVDENVSPLKRVKKRGWMPLFKNRDRIPLSDDR